MAFIEKEEFRAVMGLHSRINNILAKMVTETHYYPERNEIEYIQIKTPSPLSSNEGKWNVRKIAKNRVELMITHIIKVKYSFIGYIFGLLIVGPFFIYKHNWKDLKLYKNYLESNV